MLSWLNFRKLELGLELGGLAHLLLDGNNMWHGRGICSTACPQVINDITDVDK